MIHRPIFNKLTNHEVIFCDILCDILLDYICLYYCSKFSFPKGFVSIQNSLLRQYCYLTEMQYANGMPVNVSLSVLGCNVCTVYNCSTFHCSNKVCLNALQSLHHFIMYHQDCKVCCKVLGFTIHNVQLYFWTSIYKALQIMHRTVSIALHYKTQ